MPDVPVPEVPVVDASRDEVSVNDADNSQPIKELPSDNESPGKMLLQARLLAGLTQEQVAKELYVTAYKVKALEADDYSRLSSDTFARGYIRAYANLVKVDVVVLLTAYDALMEQLQPQATLQKPLSSATETSHRGAWQFLIVIGVFFIALWLISVWFFDNHSDDQYVISVASTSSSAVGAISSAVNSSVTVNEISKSDALMVASAPIASSFGSASSAAVLSATVVARASGASVSSAAIGLLAVVESVKTESSSSAKKTSLDELSFSFREESWLEVSDSRGDVLATELQAAGSKLTLAGLAPFDVKIGNAPAVDIFLNGKKMDVIPLMGTNVLTLKINN
jgi:cytoskeleton protein RodZ